MEIKIETRVSSQAHLAAVLDGALPADVRIVRVSPQATRGVDPGVLVAVVSAGSTALGALITGLLSVLEQARAGKIIIVGKDGWRVEVPSSTPASELKKLIDATKESDIEKIVLDK